MGNIITDFVDDVSDAWNDFTEDLRNFVQEGIAGLFGYEEPETPDGTLVTKQGTVQPLPVIYGKRAVGGTIIYEEATGTQDQNFWAVYAICDADYPIEGISEIYFDDVLVVSEGVTVPGTKYEGHFLCEITNGTHSGQPFTVLEASSDGKWTSDHKLLNTAAVAIRFTWNENVYSGLPKVLFTVKGMKTILVNSLPTVGRAYNDDPANIVFDYLTNPIYGKGLSIVDGEDLNISTFQDTLDYGDDLITSYSGGPSHKRFSCNMAVSTDNSIMSNIPRILQTCRASLPYSDGKFSLMVERHYTVAEYQTIDPTLTDYFDFNIDNIIGGWKFKQGDVSSRYNRVKAIFADEDIGYKSNFVAVESSAFRIEDGRLLEKTINLAGTTNRYRALDTASVVLRRSRQQITAAFVATQEALQVRAGTIVTITHPTPGWTAKQFRVASMSLLASGNVSVSVVEHESTVYDLSLPNEYATPADTNLPDPTVVPDLTGLTLVSNETVLIIGNDGTLVPRIKVSWTALTNPYILGYEVEYKKSADSIYLPAGTVTSATGTELYIDNVTESVDYNVRARGYNSAGFSGAWVYELSHTVVGKTSNPSDASSISFQTIAGGMRRISAEATRPADFKGFLIRARAGSSYTTWGELSVANGGYALHDENDPVTTLPFETALINEGSVTIGIKLVDTSGNESVNATLATFSATASPGDWETITGAGKPDDFANSITDPNFLRIVQGNPSLWEDATAANNATYGYIGENNSAGCRIDADGTINDVIYEGYYPANQGDVIYVSARVYVSADFNGSYGIASGTFDNSLTELPSWPGYTTTAGTTGVWKTITGSFPVSHASAEYTRPRLTVRPDATTGYVKFSSVYLSRSELGADVTDYDAAAADAQARADAALVLAQSFTESWSDEGATVGADWDFNVANRPADADILNSELFQTTDITVTVGTGGDYATINAAITGLTQLIATSQEDGLTATINLLAGFQIDEQITVNGLNLSWIIITGVDASTDLLMSAMTTDNDPTSTYPWAFSALNGGRLPVIAQNLNIIYSAGVSAGLISVDGAGSLGYFVDGFETPNTTIMTYGLRANHGGVIIAENCDLGAHRLNAYYGGKIYADGSTARGLTASQDGLISLQNGVLNTGNYTGNAFSAASYGSKLLLDQVTINIGRTSYSATSGLILIINSSILDMDNATVTGDEYLGYGIAAKNSSQASVNSLDLGGIGVEAFSVEKGSMMNANGTTGTLNQSPNVITSDGLIFR
ncbi:MAG: hypothetical protein PVI43_00115 [Candidatus Bathyarchaeota archaeon]|jgi:hypothetical protein